MQLDEAISLELFFSGLSPRDFPGEIFFRLETAPVTDAKSKGSWIGVDFDNTLATYEWPQPLSFTGDPIPEMVQRVQAWILRGITVKIYTARLSAIGHLDVVTNKLVTYEDVVGPIKAWCREHIGVELEVTNKKDFEMIECWDDRAVQVEPKTGVRMDTVFTLQRRLVNWQDTTFPEATPASCFAHLKEEIKELEEDLTDELEIADCIMLLMYMASKQQIDALGAVERKLAINELRQWNEPDASGARHHKKED